MGFWRDAKEWYRTECEVERARNPLRIRYLMKKLWPWYLACWLWPALFISQCFLGLMPSDKLLTRGFVPFLVCLAVSVAPSTKLEMSRKEQIFFFLFIPQCVLLASAIIWAVIHDRYMV